MRTYILYPADYFSIRNVDADYEYEYREAVRFPELSVCFYNYDEFAAGGALKFYPAEPEPGICIYRGWMLKPESYEQLYRTLQKKNVEMINTPGEYRRCHEFPNIYDRIREMTPGIMVYEKETPVDWQEVKRRYPRFMIKDYVKSVKGTDFPAYFDAGYSDEQLDTCLNRFRELRGGLFDGGIVIKEYVELARVQGVTNEYRAFFLNGALLSLTANSNQNPSRPAVPGPLVEQLAGLDSHFYTVDFAELADGSWTVIETGDGQVSGLSPNQFVFKFYEGIVASMESVSA